MRIGLVCEGDASLSETAFSGTAKRMFYSLKEQGSNVIPIDASLKGWRRAAAALGSFSSDRKEWRSRFRYGTAAARHRSAAASNSLKGHEVDVLLQIGATYDPPGDAPYAIYADWNLALDIDRNHSSEMDHINLMHAKRYRNSSMIFTISERLRNSFIDLYGIHPDRVTTVYAGPNFDEKLIADKLKTPKPTGQPNVLFIAKEFQRKGGDTVAEAMRIVRQRLPECVLVYAGSEEAPAALQALGGVRHLGMLDKNKPEELNQLLDAYRAADLMVLPSRRDPFPTVIREAMFFGIPCVTSNIWAMPEMVVDGETGYLVKPEDPKTLALRILELLENPFLRQRFGEAAQARAHWMFSWPSVGRSMHISLEKTMYQGVTA